MNHGRRPTLAVWKFASCDGCQLTLLDLEDELLNLVEAVEVSYFLEMSRAAVDGPYDVSLVEGSVTTPHDAERVKQVRASSATLVTIGACATAGGVQALRNFADVADYARAVYAHPSYLSTLQHSTPISAHVPVDFELRGCPVDKGQLLEVLTAYLAGRAPRIPSYPVCQDCKAAGNICVLVAKGVPCLGPVTRTGCGALCPGIGRGCFGCFGPAATVNTGSLATRFSADGATGAELVRLFRGFTAGAPEFAKESTSHAS